MSRVLNSIASRLGLGTPIRNRAFELARKSKSRGRAWWVVTGAAILVSARERKSGVTAADVARAATHGDDEQHKRDALKISKEFRRLSRILGVNVRAHPEQFLPKLAVDLGLPHAVERKAAELLGMVPPKQGSNPRGAAAGSLYTAARILRQRIGQRKVADVAGISEVTLRKVHYALAQDPRIAEQLKEAER